MIILFGGGKGGVGKTTIAVNFAVKKMKENGDLLLIDAEPIKTDAIHWCGTRDTHRIEPYIPNIQKTGRNLHKDVRSLKEKYTDIIIDTGQQSHEEFKAAMLVADVVIAPLKPSQFDLWSLTTLDLLAGEAKITNENMNLYIVFSQAHTNPKVDLLKKGIKFFKDAKLENIKLAETVIYNRVSYLRTPITGQSLSELKIDKIAEEEINALYKETLNG